MATSELSYLKTTVRKQKGSLPRFRQPGYEGDIHLYLMWRLYKAITPFSVCLHEILLT
jgi:hypothetical protein